MGTPDESIDRPAWPHAEPLGSRLLWFDGERNCSIPMVKIDPSHTDGRGLPGGWLALLPTENAAEVYLTWDPDHYPDEPQSSLWLYVEHPEYGYLIDACLNHADGEWVIVYDPACGGPNCEGWCAWCSPLDHHFYEYVSTPQEVMDRLAWLGSLSIRVVEKAPTAGRSPE